MAAKPTSSLDEVPARDLVKVAVATAVLCAVLLVCAFLILGKQGWPGWAVWGCRLLAAGVAAVVWRTAWQVLRVAQRRENGAPDAEPGAAPDPARL